jgi:hypothetical protein
MRANSFSRWASSDDQVLSVRVKLPGPIVGNRSTMYEAFKKLAIEYGDKEPYTIELLKLLPQSLPEAPVWFDNLTNVWHYEMRIAD